mmetsp:Transcript_150156/g.287607  ORF Transcript_150156/g.287607 Transcript_150156/m.287607 type:complete len:515 (-) Transcript_150156:169-1713(-)
MPPRKAKSKAKAEAKARAQPKAGRASAAAGSPAAGSGAAAVKQSRADADAASKEDSELARTENLLKECLAEKDITRCDGRVLDIAIGQAKSIKGLDADLLASAMKRMEEFREFEAELKKKAEQMRAEKAEALERHEVENDLFKDACAARQDLKKIIEDLFDAVGDGDSDKVEKFIGLHTQQDADSLVPPVPIDVEDHDGNTPLSESACYGEIELVQLLLGNGSHPDARNSQGRTPLWRAGYNGHEEVVEFLMEKGADASIENNDGEPPGRYGTPATKELIANWSKADMEEPRESLTELQRLSMPWPRILLTACSEGDSKAAIAVAKAAATGGGTQALLRTVIDFENMVDGFWTACTHGHIDLVRDLIAEQADINSSNETGLTCLMIACRKGYTGIVSELLKAGAKTHLRSENGRLALDYSRESSAGTLPEMILAHCQQRKEWTTLDEAARQAGGNKVMGREAVLDVLEERRNVTASDAATEALKGMSAAELREGGSDYQRLLEERALADVLGYG